MTSTATGAVAELHSRIEREYRQRTGKSAAYHDTALKYMPGGATRTAVYFDPYPLCVDRGLACRITDLDGNEYLDFVNNFTSLIHGHAHPGVCAAAREQIAKGTAFGASQACQADLARLICERVASVERIRFCNSGSEATLQAIRAAKAFTGRNKVIKMEGGYHGSHDAADVSMAPPLDQAGPPEAPRAVPSSAGLFKGITDDVVIAPFNNVDASLSIIDRCGTDLAAVIVEPVLGAGGMLPAHDEYLQALRTATDSSGALLILDEVLTFRLAAGGAQERYRIRPDLTSFGKIIGGGYPIGAFGGRADVMDVFDSRRHLILHSGTFNGHAVAMVAGYATLELLTAEAINRLNSLGDRLREALNAAFTSTGVLGQVTGVGSIMNYHLTAAPLTGYRASAGGHHPSHPLLHLSLLNRGVFVAGRGLMCLSTPMGESEIERAAEAFADALGELRQAGAL